MINIQKNYDLTKLNTFGVKASAKFFCELEKEEDVKELFNTKEFKENEHLFLGGGSNILFTKDFNGIVILNKLKGIEIVKEDEKNVFVKAMGGESWHDLVDFASTKGYWGIENLALVPGTVGATPVQNIGAYGIELKDSIDSVEAHDVDTCQKKIFIKEECEFGYRDSIFKSKLKGQFFISAIILKLSKIENKNVEYQALKDHIEKNKIEVKNVKDIMNAVVEIRRSKLPDPKILGNAGSFFKNVYVTNERISELKKIYPDMPYFAEKEDFQKIPAGWLIEQCGWKGKKVGNVGMHDKQALVLVNHGGANGEEIKKFADLVIGSVYEKFGLKLTPEVNIL